MLYTYMIGIYRLKLAWVRETKQEKDALTTRDERGLVEAGGELCVVFLDEDCCVSFSLVFVYILPERSGRESDREQATN